MEKVVYLIGAGFSAPLGLPVMSNFLLKSKDMFLFKPNRYEYFKNVFDTINKMSIVKNYFSSDLFNIEEVLSILEMKDCLNGNVNSHIFKQFIADVIKFYTPEIENYGERLPSNWGKFIFGKNDLCRTYGHFVANLLRLIMYRDKMGNLHFLQAGNPTVTYSVITLNYDLVIENNINFISANYFDDDKLKYSITLDDKECTTKDFSLAKLHGTVEPVTIIPPTWNKSIDANLLPTWKLAYKLLEEANHIRIIGYSLPETDSYLKYLLKSALLDSFHLKSIDVICLDNNGDVKERYDKLVQFNYYNFINANVLDYLSCNLNSFNYRYDELLSHDKIIFTTLEDAHKRFISERSRN